MPTHRVKNGYQWGRHGKVYPTKAQADKQGQAIYASGWNENKIDENKNSMKNIISLTESDLKKIIKESINKILTESIEDSYTHFAVNRKTNLIVNGWDYEGYDSNELKQFKKDYFDCDLIDYGFNPKDYKILSKKACIRQGIDPNDEMNCWSNNGEIPLSQENN